MMRSRLHIFSWALASLRIPAGIQANRYAQGGRLAPVCEYLKTFCRAFLMAGDGLR